MQISGLCLGEPKALAIPRRALMTREGPIGLPADRDYCASAAFAASEAEVLRHGQAVLWRSLGLSLNQKVREIA